MKGIKQVKNYRLVKELARGASWTVYESIDDSVNILYAIKTLQKSKDADNVKKQIKTLRTLNHENLVKIVGYEKTLNNIYLVLEYCNGGTLQDYLKYYKSKYKTPLPQNKVQFLMRQLINGIAFMTQNKILYRDLKLENILLHFNYRNSLGNNPYELYEKCSFFDSCLKISDLGFAKDHESYMSKATHCGKSLVTNECEQFSYNKSIDLFSIGAICYELLTGVNLSKQAFENYMKNDECVSRLELSQESVSFINGLLQLDSERRSEWNEVVNHPFIINDTAIFKQIFVDKTSESSDINCNVWSLFKTHMLGGNLDKIDLLILRANEQTHISKMQNEEPIIPSKSTLILKESRNSNNNSQFEEINKQQTELQYIQVKISNNLLKITEDEVRNCEVNVKSFSNSINNGCKNNSQEKNEKNEEIDIKLNCALIVDNCEQNLDCEERWEILYSEKSCVDVEKHQNHFIVMNDYFN